jgi:hypothetical protein
LLIHAVIVRQVQDGARRRFEYEGRWSSEQLFLFFEEDRGRGFIVGTLVLHLSGNLDTLQGRSTYHNKKEVVAEPRIYRRRRETTN